MGSTLRGKLIYFLGFAALGAGLFELIGWVKDPERQMPTAVRLPVGCVLGVLIGVFVTVLLGRMARDLELARTGDQAVIRARLELGRLEPTGRFWLHWALGDAPGARWVFEKQLRGPLPLERLHAELAHLAAAVDLIETGLDEQTRAEKIARLRMPRSRWVVRSPALQARARIAALAIAEACIASLEPAVLAAARDKLRAWEGDPEVLAYATWLRESADEAVDATEDPTTIERAAELAGRRGHVTLRDALVRRATRARTMKSGAAYR